MHEVWRHVRKIRYVIWASAVLAAGYLATHPYIAFALVIAGAFCSLSHTFMLFTIHFSDLREDEAVKGFAFTGLSIPVGLALITGATTQWDANPTIIENLWTIFGWCTIANVLSMCVAYDCIWKIRNK